MRKGFGFVEVLVSIVILSMVGMALLKFNAFNKHIMQKNMQLFENSMICSPLLYLNNLEKYSAKGQVNLLDITNFQNLDDDDRRFLKTQNFTLFVQEGEKAFLFNDTAEDRYMQAYSVSIKYKDSSANYLLLKEGK